jgi:hypothetical protein
MACFNVCMRALFYSRYRKYINKKNKLQGVLYGGAIISEATAHIAFFLICTRYVFFSSFFDCTKIWFLFVFLWMIMMKRKNRKETRKKLFVFLKTTWLSLKETKWNSFWQKKNIIWWKWVICPVVFFWILNF